MAFSLADSWLVACRHCTAGIGYFLNDWSGINVPLAVQYIQESQGYDGGIAQGPGLESHGSFAFCVRSSSLSLRTVLFSH
jgi:geranylgeranyl transferase type-1 subunit beta